MNPLAPTLTPGWRRVRQAPGTWSVPQDSLARCHFPPLSPLGTLCETLVCSHTRPCPQHHHPSWRCPSLCLSLADSLGHCDRSVLPAARDAAMAPSLHRTSSVPYGSVRGPMPSRRTPPRLTAPQLPALGDRSGGLLPAQPMSAHRAGVAASPGWDKGSAVLAPCLSACTKRCLLEWGRPWLCGQC